MGSYTSDDSNTLYDQEVHTIHIPEEVRQSGKATPELIAESVAFLQKDGIIILDNAIDPAHLNTLNDILSREATEIANYPNHHFNFGKETRNMDQAPPVRQELMFKDVWCNPFAAAVLANVLGPRPVVHYANGNTAMPARGDGDVISTRQPVHSDCEWLHPVYFPFAYVLNVPLISTSPANGSTEVWPGSHHVSSYESHPHSHSADVEPSLTVRTSLVSRRRTHSPPVQPTTRQGSMVIRDLRLWHAGMPNRSPDPRVMLAFVVQPAWYRGRSRIVLPAAVREMVESWADELGFAANYVEGEVDHRKLSSLDADFRSDSQALQEWAQALGSWPPYVPKWY